MRKTIALCFLLSGCTSMEYLIQHCQSIEGHPVIIVDTQLEASGVRCEVVEL